MLSVPLNNITTLRKEWPWVSESNERSDSQCMSVCRDEIKEGVGEDGTRQHNKTI